jgi:hypothetical protein
LGEVEVFAHSSGDPVDGFSGPPWLGAQGGHG